MTEPSLERRKAIILQAVVIDYVETAEPVGSANIAARYDLGVKPATVRNELAELSDHGYLTQPHVSAGRIPTNQGYRYFVDWLMSPAPPSPDQTSALSAEHAQHLEVERLLDLTSRLLARATQYPSLVTAPDASETIIREVLISQPADDRLLVLVVGSSGQVAHRLILLSAPLRVADVTALNRLATNAWQDRSVSMISPSEQPELPNELHALEGVWRQVCAAMDHCLTEFNTCRVFTDGLAHLLSQPEFQGSDQLPRVLNTLSSLHLIRLLQRLRHSEAVQVLIGDEHAVPGLEDCSCVVSPYRIGDHAVGALSVIGPTRMRYDVATSAVQVMAEALSQVLTQISLD